MKLINSFRYMSISFSSLIINLSENFIERNIMYVRVFLNLKKLEENLYNLII